MRADKVKIFEESFQKIKDHIEKLLKQSDAKCAFLIDRDGNLITYSGDTKGIDIESFAALAAADFAATSQLASLIGEKDFETLYHQGENQHLYFQLVAKGIVLAVVFDHRTTLGLVRVRVKSTADVISSVIDEIFKQAETQPIKEEEVKDITKDIEQELDRLFGG